MSEATTEARDAGGDDGGDGGNGGNGFALAHVSDLHATPVRLASPRDLAGKRALGWLSWRRRRRHVHLAHVLEALIDDLHARRPDHVGVTGDLTHLGLPSEIAAASAWLARLVAPSDVSVVPGNHDAYAGAGGPERWSPWSAYMGEPDAETAGDGDPATRGFPWVRRLGPVALVGVSTAQPTAPLLATGRVGDRQRARLEALLAALGREGRARVVLMHHPPVPAGQSRRRQLDDGTAVCALLGRAGAELVLHGHTHRTHVAALAGPEGAAIPVVGVPSASDVGHRAGREAGYHVYRIVRGEAGGFRVSLEARGWDPAAGCFVARSAPALLPGA